jgi:diguanylate cyclase (GGDEF)-like protein
VKTFPDPLRRRLDRATLTAFGGWTILSLLLILGTAISLEQAQSTQRNAILDRAQAGASALEQTMLREFEAVNRLEDLAQVRMRLTQRNGSAPASRDCNKPHDPCQATLAVVMATQMIEQQMAGNTGILQIRVLKLDGTQDWYLRPDRASQLSTMPELDDRMRDPRSGLVISNPQIDPTLHDGAPGWVVHVSRALTDENGKTQEIGVVTLDPVVLSNMIGLTTTAATETSVVQLRDSGAVVAQSSGLALGLTLKVAPTDPVIRAAKGLGACLARADLAGPNQRGRAIQLCHEYRDLADGVDRLVGFGVPEFSNVAGRSNAPLVVSRSFDTDTALADFYGLRFIVMTVVLALVTGAFIATRLFLTNFQLHQSLGEQALRDPLTGLYNRRYFTDIMNPRMATAARQGDTAAVLLVDLDGFKQVNDTRGHQVGDGLLRDVARRLRHCTTSSDTVIRLGGDEFAVVRIGRPQRRDVAALARYIVNELSETYEVEKFHVRISASIGIAMPPDGGEELNDLLRSADIAMYFVKSEGGSAYQLFDPAMENSVRTRRALEIDLREALGRDELEVYYQPLVQLDPHRVSGFEALLRWHHPTLGMVMPSRFIPVAEETGLIAPIGEWVLRQACLEAASWPGRTRIAVNLSPIQFERSDIVDIVAAALRESRLEPDRLELEITEGVVMRDTGDVLATMRRLRGLGVRLALDDFGTGYASLSYLRSFPFDKVKIDGSFLADLSGDGGTIIRAVLGLCRHLDLDMLVEGVETDDQLDWLRREGCTEVQGHLFSPPRPASGVAEIIGEIAGRAVRTPVPEPEVVAVTTERKPHGFEIYLNRSVRVASSR